MTSVGKDPQINMDALDVEAISQRPTERYLLPGKYVPYEGVWLSAAERDALVARAKLADRLYKALCWAAHSRMREEWSDSDEAYFQEAHAAIAEYLAAEVSQ